MKNLALILLVMTLLAASIFAQSDIKLRQQYGAESVDLQSVLYFENIALERLVFSGNDLKNKNYQISIEKFVNGELSQTDVVFDSKEDSYFKLNDARFGFRVFAKRESDNRIRFEFQFNGFSKGKEYRVAPNQKNFALKNFLGAQPEQTISLNFNNYILTMMMPYVKKDGSTVYCEVAQSGTNPEELGKKYPIPLYFLIGINFQ